MAPSQRHRHRRGRPDRLRAPVPHRVRSDARARHAGRASSCSRSRHAVKAAEGTALELFDCAFPLLAGIDIYDDAKQAFDGTQRRAAGRRAPAHEGHGARRPARGQRRHLQAAGRGDRRRRGRRHQGARGRQPGQHERADRDEQRRRRAARALHRDDAARPQPRGRPARARRPAPRCRTSPTWRSGATTRPRCIPTCSTRRCAASARGTRSATRRGSPTSTSRAWASAARRSSRRAAPPRPRRRPTRRSTTCTTGCYGTRGRRLGLDGRAVATAPTASRRGSSPRSRCAPRTATWEIVQGLDVPEFSQQRIDKTVAELLEERDAVTKLGLVN